MKQGTISVLYGCHSPFHSFLVLIAWIKLYRKIPKFWQVVCILLHDIGHWGLNYLDNLEEKKIHWQKGARIAERMFGEKGWYFVASHCSYSGCNIGKLKKADKYSWYIAPKWWLFLNTLAEPKLRMGYGTWEAVNKFKEQVKESVESGQFRSTHQMYLERCNRLQKEDKSKEMEGHTPRPLSRR